MTASWMLHACHRMTMPSHSWMTWSHASRERLSHHDGFTSSPCRCRKQLLPNEEPLNTRVSQAQRPVCFVYCDSGGSFCVASSNSIASPPTSIVDSFTLR